MDAFIDEIIRYHHPKSFKPDIYRPRERERERQERIGTHDISAPGPLSSPR